MAQSLIQRLSQQYKISIRSPEQLKNGNILMIIALKVLYSGSNSFIESKLTEAQSSAKSTSPLANSNKAGNNVIIINSLLKHIKSDNSIEKQIWVKELTFYNLLQNQQILQKFINWMIQHNNKKSQPNYYTLNTNRQAQQQTLPLKQKKKSLNQNIYQDMTEEQINSMSSNRFRNLQVQNPRFKTQQNQPPQNQFDNLYFASNLKNKPQQQPIMISPEKGDKIVRKGSFKLLKPKVMFMDDSTNEQPKQFTEAPKNPYAKQANSQNQTQKMSNFYQPDELKEISMIEPSNHQQSNIQNTSHQQNFYHQNSSQIFEPQDISTKKTITQTPSLSNKQPQVQNRKTIPKNLSKPPLCRSSSRKNKQNMQNGPSDKEKTFQQSLKKKNFFNFSQGEDIVSNFNYQLEPKDHKQALSNLNEQQENYESTSRSKVFAKIKDLNGNFNEMRQYMSLESDGSNTNNIIEENDYALPNNKNNQNSSLYNNTHQIYSQLKPAHEPSQSSSKLLKLKNHFLQKEIYNIQKQINKQQSSLHQLQNFQLSSHTAQPNNYQSGYKRSVTSLHYEQRQSGHTSTNKNSSFESTKKSNRKVSKIQLNELQESQKQMIIDWLDSLHFVDKAKLISHDEVFQKFKDGTKFVELCNHYIGRGKPLAYFNNPKKNAQIHSNYSKVFDYLKSYSQWDHPELLFSYELFVPYPQQSSVWNLLFGMFKLLTKKGKIVNKSASKQESLIITKELESSRKKSAQKQFQLIEVDAPKQESTKKLLDFKPDQKQQTSRKSHSSSRKQSNFTKPIEFVREIPENLKRNDLVQQDQQHESCNGSDYNTKQNEVNMNVYFEGYKDRYMRKTLQNLSSKQKSKCASLQTPKKWGNQLNPHEQSFIYPYRQSINKGSIHKSSSKKMLQNQLKKMENSSCKLLSAKKSQRQSQKARLFPKISLNMQIKVEKIMKYFQLNKLIDDKNNQKLAKLQLLHDSIRNGVLVNILLGKFVPALQGKYIQTARSIEHCRQNYMNFYGLIKNKYGQEGFEMVEKYLDFTQDILKGEKTLFYGIAYSLIQLMEKKGFRIEQQEYTKKTDSQSLGTYRTQKQNSLSMIEYFSRNHIQWIRYLQRSNQRIIAYKLRTQEDLKKSIYSGLLLYAFSENTSIKPIYINPCNLQQRQANLKKIICYLVQNKIALDKQDFYNVKAISQSSTQVLNGLIEKLVRYTVEKYGVGEYGRGVNLLMGSGSNDENDNIVGNRVGGSAKTIALGKYLQDNQNEHKHPNTRLQTTTAEYINQTHHNPYDKPHNQPQHKHHQQQRCTINIQIPWLRKLGFINCPLIINNGIILCRLISKLTRTNIKFNQNLTTDARIPKAQSLGYIRKAIKLIPSFKYDEVDIYEADEVITLKVFDVIKDRFRSTYEMTKILGSK